MDRPGTNGEIAAAAARRFDRRFGGRKRPGAPIKVLAVIGTRPEVIKLAPAIYALERDRDRFETRVCITGQHREMVDQMLHLFEIEPDHDLAVMRRDQSLTEITRSVLAGMDWVLQAERPDWLLIQGDTTTVMAAALAAYYHNVRVAHLEAGLRTFNRHSPFPEEVNRRLATVLADLHFAPTQRAAENLRREGIPDVAIRVTGNTVIDAFKHVAGLAFDPLRAGLPKAALNGRRVVLVTAHRGENFGRGIEEICAALRTIANRHDDLQLVFPVHLNPHVREPVYRHLSGIENVSLIEPLDYQSLVWLLNRCHFLITDSGGLQEEAAGVGKPMLVLREWTERPEVVEAGIAKLVGSDSERIVSWAELLLSDEATHGRMAQAISPYGTGHAAAEIVEALRLGRSRVGAPPSEPPADPLLADRPYRRSTADGALRARRRRFKRRPRDRAGAAEQVEVG